MKITEKHERRRLKLAQRSGEGMVLTGLAVSGAVLSHSWGRLGVIVPFVVLGLALALFGALVAWRASTRLRKLGKPTPSP